MNIFARGTEHALDVAVQRSQHADPRVHHEVAALSSTDQASDCGLPFGQVLLGLVSFKRGCRQTPKAPAAELFYSFEIVAGVPAEEH